MTSPQGSVPWRFPHAHTYISETQREISSTSKICVCRINFSSRISIPYTCCNCNKGSPQDYWPVWAVFAYFLVGENALERIFEDLLSSNFLKGRKTNDSVNCTAVITGSLIRLQKWPSKSAGMRYNNTGIFHCVYHAAHLRLLYKIPILIIACYTETVRHVIKYRYIHYWCQCFRSMNAFK